MAIATLKKLRPRASTIGLDIGARTVRAVQLVCSGSTYSVEQVGRQSWHLNEDREEQGPPQVGNSLARCVSGANFRGKRVHTAMNTPELEVHAIELPEGVVQSSAEEVERIVQWEVQRLTTHEHESIETRHWHLPKARPSVPNAIGVAALTKTVADAVNLCRDAGLTCTCVDVAAAALVRFGSIIAVWPENCVWGILDLGFRRTRLVVCMDDVPVLIRDVGTGGAAWTLRIAEELQVSEKSAEVHKCDAGIGMGERGCREGGDGPPLKELGGILAGILKNDLRVIATEIKRSYEYVLNCYGGREAGMLVLVGGGAALQNLPENLTDALGIEVQRGSQVAAGTASRLEHARIKSVHLDEYALAIGLAIED